MARSIIVLIMVFILNSICYAQYTVEIMGAHINVNINPQNKTAVLIDCTHKIDDNRRPMYIYSRKIPNINSKSTTLIIPELVKVNGENYTITEIGEAAFADYTNFEYVEIPKSVVSIGDYAFFGTNIEKILIPSNVTKIGNRAFGKCKNLKYITLPSQISLGYDVYSESKVKVTYYDELADTEVTGDIKDSDDHKKSSDNNNTLIEEDKNNWSYTPVKSDLDINIPISKNLADNTFAIIIANEEYENESNVPYAIQDGETFRLYCHKTLGIPDENIRFKTNATYNNIRGMVNWANEVAKLYKGEAKFIFYYSGHGVQGENEITSLLPVDGSSHDEESGYTLDNLYRILGNMPSKNVIVFLDACFSGKKRNDELLAAVRGARNVKVKVPEGNMVVFSAAQEKETALSYEEKGHGLFTYYLLKKIKESKGNVNLGELADYIGENVSKYARINMNSQQTPNTSVSPGILANWRNIKLAK